VITLDIFGLGGAENDLVWGGWSVGNARYRIYHSGNLTNLNQLTNGPGYITGITSSMVTTALGYTPYNSTNPSGYISGNQTITLTGDASGSGTTSISVTVNRLTYQGNYANGDVGTTRGPDGLSIKRSLYKRIPNHIW